jgi:hypothetical protein
MFMLLAIGLFMDTNQPAYSIEAEKYHQLARAALFQSSFLEEPSMAAVQALVGVPYVRVETSPTFSSTVFNELLSVLGRPSRDWFWDEVGYHGVGREDRTECMFVKKEVPPCRPLIHPTLQM